MKKIVIMLILVSCMGQTAVAQMKVVMPPGEQQRHQLHMKKIEMQKDTFLVALLQSIKKIIWGSISYVGAGSIFENAGIVCPAECINFKQEVAHVKKEAQKKGQDINARDKCGDTALILACANGDTCQVVRLLRRKAQVNVRNYSGHTALMIAAYYGKINVVQILLALAKDLDIQQQDFCGNSAVYWAIMAITKR